MEEKPQMNDNSNGLFQKYENESPDSQNQPILENQNQDMFSGGENQNHVQWEFNKPPTEYSKEALNHYRRINVSKKYIRF